MSAQPASPPDLEPERLAALLVQLERGELKGCCAAVFEHPAVHWLLGGELHPGGERLTRETLALVAPQPTERLLDVASGAGTTAILAAREHGCASVGLDYGVGAVAGARSAAASGGLGDRASFVAGDAEALPFDDASFDVVVCECAVSTFADKAAAIEEMRRVLRPAGRLAISDVTADEEALPPELRGAIATVACVGGALSRSGYPELLAGAGFEVTATRDAADDVAAMADRVHSRLRAARILGLEGLAPIEGGLSQAIGLAAEARRAVAAGSLGYGVWVARAA